MKEKPYKIVLFVPPREADATDTYPIERVRWPGWVVGCAPGRGPATAERS